ncbi:MAG: twin-arginine translocase TatA/TatE family subunit [Saprospiraceae bacterium]|jgi:sec-independent protein translocase protein TatA|nr:twin-arginine translocase TatA/TatE family subunit [Saprospiraceae bacterium]
MFNLIFGMGPQEILVVALIILVLFGGRKIPELMRGLGQGIREFNNAKANIESEVKDSMKELEEKSKEKQKSGPITRND